MGIAKIVLNDVTQIDLTADTVAQNNLLSGYTAHDKTGAAIVGTASGGGGLDYEEGTWTPVGNVTNEFISFSKQHDSLPFMVFVCHAGTPPPTSNMQNVRMLYFNIADFFGTTEYIPSTTVGVYTEIRGVAWFQRRSTSTTYANAQAYIYHDATIDPFVDELPASTNKQTYTRGWVSETGFYAWANNSSSGTDYKWQPSGSYRWVAVWKTAQ